MCLEVGPLRGHRNGSRGPGDRHPSRPPLHFNQGCRFPCKATGRPSPSADDAVALRPKVRTLRWHGASTEMRAAQLRTARTAGLEPLPLLVMQQSREHAVGLLLLPRCDSDGARSPPMARSHALTYCLCIGRDGSACALGSSSVSVVRRWTGRDAGVGGRQSTDQSRAGVCSWVKRFAIVIIW